MLAQDDQDFANRIRAFYFLAIPHDFTRLYKFSKSIMQINNSFGDFERFGYFAKDVRRFYDPQPVNDEVVPNYRILRESFCSTIQILLRNGNITFHGSFGQVADIL